MNFDRQNAVQQKLHNTRALCAPTLGFYGWVEWDFFDAIKKKN